MAKAPWYSRKVLRTAFPATIVILAVFVSVMFLAEHIEAFFLVFILWITLPVLAIYIYRKLKHYVRPKQ